MGPVLVTDMQTPKPIPSKTAVSIFWSKLLGNVLKRMKNPFSGFFGVINDFQVFLINAKKKFWASQKVGSVLNRIFVFQIFFCAILSF